MMSRIALVILGIGLLAFAALPAVQASPGGSCGGIVDANCDDSWCDPSGCGWSTHCSEYVNTGTHILYPRGCIHV